MEKDIVDLKVVLIIYVYGRKATMKGNKTITKTL
jgi:hypothetical protein